MTGKIKQSIAIQRQFPDHIKENYPVFVEFIKLYYDYLEQTQSQNLESIKDIDTTLDEFIDKFKNELAKNFPIDLSSDKRLILKHLREFYLSRGSEASYKFLFRTLFGKDNVDIFYPSTQILRASDGKWQQDVSIFVTINGVKPDINSIIGKTILITNAKGKVIRTFVNRIQPYSDTICEVFIQRDYINEISIGDIVSCEGTAYSATILACPTKVSIYKAGKGFKVGELYALKTQIGRGCVIKITKVGTEGEIKAIQVVRFGLDYKTKFYSYLSSKDLQAIEYNHPLTKNWEGVGLPTPYNENSGGFIDYGWGSKQTYFYYDDTIPVATPDHASDRFFANPDYVGEVVQQFYSDDSVNPIDEDLAIIEIELGAVAKYPGYYMKADGFVSDEIYIQDGKYYQAFSYVIKVEEELRKYADIVKALVHPAGMKLYAEYNISNILEISASVPKLFTILQLPLTDHAPSIGVVDDRGYSYDSYTTSLVDGNVITEPSLNANKVYARQGKASLLSEKITNDAIQGFIDGIDYKNIEKGISEFIDQLDPQNKDILKPIQDVLFEYLEVYSNNIIKPISEISNSEDSSFRGMHSLKQDIQLLIESQIKNSDKNVSDVIIGIVEDNVKNIIKNVAESVTNEDDKSLIMTKTAAAALILISDIISNEPVKNIFDVTNLPSDSLVKEAIKNLSDSISDYVEARFINDDKSIEDVQTIVELLSNALSRGFSDSYSISDNDSIIPIKNNIDVVDSPTDEYLAIKYKNNSESISTQENRSFDYERGLFDSTSLLEYVLVAFLREFYDTFQISDSTSNNLKSNQSDSVLFDDTSINDLEKITNENTELVDSILGHFNEKTISEIVDTNLQNLSFSLQRAFEDVFNAQDIPSNNIHRVFSDIQSGFLESLDIQKVFLIEDLYSGIIDSYIRAYVKNISEDITAIENISNFLNRMIYDSYSLVDIINNEVNKVLADSINSITEVVQRYIEKSIVENIDSIDNYSAEYEKPLEDALNQIDNISNLISRSILDSAEYIDSIAIEKAKLLLDSASIADEIVSSYDSNYSDQISQIIDGLNHINTDKSINDLIDIISDNLENYYNKPIDDIVEYIEEYSNEYSSQYYDAIVDYLDKIYFILIDSDGIRNLLSFEEVMNSDTYSSRNIKSLIDVINNSTDGRIILSPYGSELYFSAVDDYQPATPIT